MIQSLRTLIRTQPILHRWVCALRARSVRRHAERFQAYLAEVTEQVEHPVFVKVGANDGITGDPCGDVFLKHPKWTGLLIEPVPYCVAKLKAVYSDPNRFRIEAVAVGEAAGTARFHYVSEEAKRDIPDLPEWFDQIGSFEREHLVKHWDGRFVPYLREMEVRVERLDSILRRQALGRIDLLHVDTEGYDLHVLRSVDLKEHKPVAILIEHKHLSVADRDAMKALLEGAGYRVGSTGVDFFALHRDAGRLQPRASSQPRDAGHPSARKAEIPSQ